MILIITANYNSQLVFDNFLRAQSKFLRMDEPYRPNVEFFVIGGNCSTNQLITKMGSSDSLKAQPCCDVSKLTM